MYFKILLMCSLIVGSYCEPLPFTNELGSAFQNMWTDFMGRIEQMTTRFQQTLHYISTNFRPPPFGSQFPIGPNNSPNNIENIGDSNVQNVVENDPSNAQNNAQNNGNKDQIEQHKTDNVINAGINGQNAQLPPETGKPFAQVPPLETESDKIEAVPALKGTN